MSKNQSSKIVGYSIPNYSSGKHAVVSYYVRDLSDQNRMLRKQIKLNHIKCEKERLKYATILCKELYDKLKKGWHPDGVLDRRKEVVLSEAIQRYLKAKEKDFANGYIRKDSLRTIKSFCTILDQWLISSQNKFISLENFTHTYAKEFLEHIYEKRNASPRTYNNYLTATRTMFNQFKESYNITTNPFERIKAKPLVNKSEKVPLTKEERIKVREYLTEHNKHYLLCCLMVYHCGVRRTELTKLKLSDIDIKNSVIRITAQNAKMKRERYASIPQEVIELMIELNIFSAPGRYYIVGKDWQPSDVAISPKKLSDEWTRLRKHCQLHPQAQFYSLRKTGGIERAQDQLSIQAIKDFFGHTGLSAAVNYLENHRSKGNEELKKYSQRF